MLSDFLKCGGVSVCSTFLLSLFLISTGLHADISYWNDPLVRSYVHNSELQRRWAFSFIAPYLRGAKGDERILDMGCGDGKITADIAKFVPEGSVLGVDLSKAMLEWAKKQYPVLEYPNLSFQEGDFLSPVKADPFDWIVSFCAFQHCSDQEAALKAMAQKLKPEGKLLILVPAMQNGAWNQARSTVQGRARWAPYWQGVVPRQFRTPEQYVALLEQAHFQVIRLEVTPTVDPFVDREEIVAWLQGTFSPRVPPEESSLFYNAWIDEYLRLSPQSIGPDGEIYARLGYIGIEAALEK